MTPDRHTRFKHLAGIGFGKDEPVRISWVIGQIGDVLPGAGFDAKLRHTVFVEQPNAAMAGIGEGNSTGLVDGESVRAADAAGRMRKYVDLARNSIARHRHAPDLTGSRQGHEQPAFRRVESDAVRARASVEHALEATIMGEAIDAP